MVTGYDIAQKFTLRLSYDVDIGIRGEQLKDSSVLSQCGNGILDAWH